MRASQFIAIVAKEPDGYATADRVGSCFDPACFLVHEKAAGRDNVMRDVAMPNRGGAGCLCCEMVCKNSQEIVPTHLLAYWVTPILFALNFRGK